MMLNTKRILSSRFFLIAGLFLFSVTSHLPAQLPSKATEIWEKNKSADMPRNTSFSCTETISKLYSGKTIKESTVERKFQSSGENSIYDSVIRNEILDKEEHILMCSGPKQGFIVRRASPSENWTLLEAVDSPEQTEPLVSLSTNLASKISGYIYRGVALADIFANPNFKIKSAGFVSSDNSKFRVDFEFDSDELAPPFYMACTGYFVFLPNSDWRLNEVQWRGTNRYKQTFDKEMLTTIEFDESNCAKSFFESEKAEFLAGDTSLHIESVSFDNWDQIKFAKAQFRLEYYGISLRKQTPWWRRPASILIGLGAVGLVVLVFIRWRSNIVEVGK